MRAILLGMAAMMAVAAEAATPPAQASAATPTLLEVRFVVPCQPGDQTYVMVGGNEEVCLGKDKLLDASSVVKVQRYPVLPKAVMEISDAASERFYDLSFNKEGERVGFVFNGRLIFVPVIYGPVKTKELQITLKNNPEDIDALVAAFPGAVAAK